MMSQNNLNSSMTEAEFNNLCSHYKDTSEIHIAFLKQRDRRFYALLAILVLFCTYNVHTELINDILLRFFEKGFDTLLHRTPDFFGSLLWLLLFGVSTQYYQSVIQIEREYTYIHHLEELINRNYEGTLAFTREGKSYETKHPLFSKWIGFMYTLTFPAIILLSIMVKILADYLRISELGWNFGLSITCFFLIFITTIMYIWRLHIDFFSKIMKFFSKKLPRQ